MKAYKGFNRDMTCRGYQFEDGKTYAEDTAKLCISGFHACEYPLDCFSYYSPTESVFREVDLEDVSDERRDDTKVCGKTIKIGASIDIIGMVKASFDFIMSKHVTENDTDDDRSANSATGYYSANSATGDRSANSATGDFSANSATGDFSANSATGDRSANSATGDFSANSATGDFSANSATGYGSVNSATGHYSANSATGDFSVNSATGYGSVNSATGYGSANSATGYGSANVSTGALCENSGEKDTINVGWGYKNKCKGKIGAYIVLCERGDWDGEKYPMIGEPVLIKIDGITLKEDTWYILKNGEVIEYTEDNN